MSPQACFDRIAWLYNPLMKLSGKPREYYGAIKSIVHTKTDAVLEVELIPETI